MESKHPEGPSNKTGLWRLPPMMSAEPSSIPPEQRQRAVDFLRRGADEGVLPPPQESVENNDFDKN